MVSTSRALAFGLTAATLLATCACAATDARNTAATSLERAFPAGGNLNMHLSAGKYTILGAADGRVRVDAKTREPGDKRKVRLDLEGSGTGAMLRVDGPSNGFEVAIQVPARTDLWIRLTAGDLTIGGVEGHKNVSAWAGELKVAVGDGSAYRSVDTSVLAGEIQAAPFRGGTGGVFRSFSWKGPGKYDLRARLTAGEIQLRGESASSAEP